MATLEWFPWPGLSIRLLESIKRTIGLTWKEDNDMWNYFEKYCSEEEEKSIHGTADHDEEELQVAVELVNTDWDDDLDSTTLPRRFSVSDARCAALEKLLSRKNQTSVFKDTISKVLLIVCEKGIRNVAEVLLKFNPDCNYMICNFETCLHAAIHQRDATLVKMLVEKGAEINEHYRVSPLLMTCLYGDMECTRTLLDLGADVNATNDEDKPILVEFFLESYKREHSIDILELLLQRGADPNAGSENGMSVESLESQWGRFPRRNFFNNNIHNDPQQLCEFLVKVTRLLLHYGFVPSCCKTSGFLSLSLRHLNTLFPLAGLLLENGVPFAPDHSCWSRCDALKEAIESSLHNDTEARPNYVLEKANFVMDLATVDPPAFRFTFEGEGVVGTIPAPLESLCMATVRNLLMPWPLDEKVQALPISQFLKDILLPLKK